MDERPEHWQSKVREALVALGGRDAYVPAAKLRAAVAKPGSEESADFGLCLKLAGKTFTQFLRDMQDLSVQPQAGSDSLVGYRGAVLPQAATGLSLRGDVFAAFTQASPRPFAYVPSRDVFTDVDADAPDAIAVPRITRDDLFDQRREFVGTIDDAAARERLNETLDYSPRALADFTQLVGEYGLKAKWHSFRYSDIVKRIEVWAGANGIAVSPSWYERRGAHVDTPQEILALLARQMTDDEVRALNIPFRAVEAFYRSANRGHGRPD